MSINSMISGILVCLFIQPAIAADITINVTNIESTQGSIQIALFTNSGNFPDASTKVQGIIVPIESNSVMATFTNLAEDDYAIAVFHDKNGNSRLDKNFFGIPKEPYGFSGNSIKRAPPDFSTASTSLTNIDINLTIKLR